MICELCGSRCQSDDTVCYQCDAAIIELAEYLHRAKRQDLKKIERLAKERADQLRLEHDAQTFDESKIIGEAERFARGW